MIQPDLETGANVNLKEGTRRLALLLGAVGAIFGCFVSYLQMQSLLNQSAHHNKFEHLASSDVIRQEQHFWPLTLRYAADKAIEAFRKLPASQQREIYDHLTTTEQVSLLAKLKCEPILAGTPSTATTRENLVGVPNHPGYEIIPPGAESDDPYACTAEPSDPPPSTVNKGGVKTIRWTKGLGIESLETEDGETLYPTPAPSRWLYLVAAILPALGFALPWGLVRAVGWVAAGFLATSK